MAELDISPDPVASLWKSRDYLADELGLLGASPARRAS